jgi:hypothetical protein
MSHHFDTPTAREGPRINLCDFYFFRETPGKVAMALTVNPEAGAGGPDTFREEGLYAFRFDLNDDSREEATSRFVSMRCRTRLAMNTGRSKALRFDRLPDTWLS